jgi:hypothetical protein
MPWQRLRRPHVRKIRGLLEEHYQPATANRMLSALRGVFKEMLALAVDDDRGEPGGDQHPRRAGGARTPRPRPLHR